MPSSAWHRRHRHLHSFPTRRSSDLSRTRAAKAWDTPAMANSASTLNPLVTRNSANWVERRQDDLLGSEGGAHLRIAQRLDLEGEKIDRKSTRLNSSHMSISYAVFCLAPPSPPPTLFPYTTLFRSFPDASRESMGHTCYG